MLQHPGEKTILLRFYTSISFFRDTCQPANPLHPPFIPEIGVPNEEKYLLVWKGTAAISPLRKKVGILLKKCLHSFKNIAASMLRRLFRG
jgi:hypothetical protein